MSRLTVTHTTTYRYREPVHYALQQVRLTPKTRPEHRVVHWQVTIEGGQIELSFEDQHNNHVDLVSFAPDVTEIAIHCEGQVETSNTHGVVGQHRSFVPLWAYRRRTGLTRAGARIKALAAQAGDDEPLALFHKISQLIAADVAYETGSTDAGTTAEAALAGGRGVCQDHAHILIAAARHLEFPARYVSGYLMMNDRIEQDATHAWAEVHLTGLGWVGFDVSNGISPDERYVRVATGLDYSDAAPIQGMRYGDGQEELLVNLQVQQ